VTDMKLKARDIIAGWPRGRTTSVMFQSWQYETYWAGLWKKASGITLKEHTRNVEYHFWQSVMAEEYRELLRNR
jgi:hypothetical protein